LLIAAVPILDKYNPVCALNISSIVQNLIQF
jgi:hypothetical protein